DKQINATDRDNPEKEEPERSKLSKRIESWTKQSIERTFNYFKSSPKDCPNEADHLLLRKLCGPSTIMSALNGTTRATRRRRTRATSTLRAHSQRSSHSRFDIGQRPDHRRCIGT